MDASEFRAARAARPANYGMHLLYAVLLTGGGVTAVIVGKNSSGGAMHTRAGIVVGVLLFACAYVLLRRVHHRGCGASRSS